MGRIQAVEITVRFNAARICFRAGITVFPYAIAVFQRTAISLCEVEHIIIRIYSQKIGYVHRSAEELDCVIGTFEHIDVFYLCTATHTIQCQTVVFDIGSGTGPGITDLHVSQ